MQIRSRQFVALVAALLLGFVLVTVASALAPVNDSYIDIVRQNSQFCSDGLEDGPRGEVMRREDQFVRNMVADDLATHETVRSGGWNNPLTWKDGRVPDDGARVIIHTRHRVKIYGKINTHLRTLRVDGRLLFYHKDDTQLIVDTMVTMPGSYVRIGMPKHPIQADKTATIIIKDYNDEGMITDDPASPDYDPLRIGQGLITFGRLVIAGAAKTPYAALAGNGATAGSDTLSLAETPQGWRVGDQVVVLGVNENGLESEKRTITAIDDASITLDSPLDYDHLIPDYTISNVQLQVHVANLTRNVIIKSDDSVNDYADREERIEHSGHVLFMHNNDVNIRYAQFLNLGRTDKSRPLDETRFNENDEATYIGANQAARYPVHFHRAGWQGAPGYIYGNVVMGSPGWGYVNHSSNAVMKKNIGYGVYGSAFVTEAGDEQGVFKGNMAIDTHGLGRGSVKDWKQRKTIEDWGFHGHGFWMNGMNVEFVNNIVNGSSNFAYGIARTPIDTVSQVVTDTSSGAQVSYHQVALKRFEGNVAYGNAGGVFGIISGTRDGTTEVLNSFLAWNNQGGATANFPGNVGDEWLSWWYPDNIKLVDPTFISDIHDPKWVGIGTQSKLRSTEIINPRIEGFAVGIMVPSYGQGVIDGGYLNNLVDMEYVHGDTNRGPYDTIKGDLQFGTLPADGLQGRERMKLKMALKPRWNKTERQFLDFHIYYEIDDEPVPLRVWDATHQAPDYVIEVGPQQGKTNAQLVSEGKRPVGGAIYPDDSVERTDLGNVRVTNK